MFRNSKLHTATDYVVFDAVCVLSSCWLSTDEGFIWSFIAPVIATLLVRTQA